MISIKNTICAVFILTACTITAQKTPAEKFVMFYNQYQTDSLTNLLDKNFTYTRTFSSYTNDKQSFLNDLQNRTAIMHASLNIISSDQQEFISRFTVKDKSDYFTYLGINPPTWILIVYTNHEHKISACKLDTTTSYRKYNNESAKKYEAFKKWYDQKHTGQTVDLPTETAALITLLKEYAKNRY